MYRDLYETLDNARSKRMRMDTSMPTRVQQALQDVSKTELERRHQVMNNIRNLLAHFDKSDEKYRSSVQIRVHQKMLATICMLVYGEKLYRKHLPEIMRYNKFPSVRQQMFFSAPRRGGKTEALAQFVAAVMLGCPQAERLVIFSPSKRASGKSGLLGNIRKKLIELGLDEKKIIESNGEDVVIVVNGQQKRISGYPGAVHTLV